MQLATWSANTRHHHKYKQTLKVNQQCFKLCVKSKFSLPVWNWRRRTLGVLANFTSASRINTAHHGSARCNATTTSSICHSYSSKELINIQPLHLKPKHHIQLSGARKLLCCWDVLTALLYDKLAHMRVSLSARPHKAFACFFSSSIQECHLWNQATISLCPRCRQGAIGLNNSQGGKPHSSHKKCDGLSRAHTSVASRLPTLQQNLYGVTISSVKETRTSPCKEISCLRTMWTWNTFYVPSYKSQFSLLLCSAAFSSGAWGQLSVVHASYKCRQCQHNTSPKKPFRGKTKTSGSCCLTRCITVESCSRQQM